WVELGGDMGKFASVTGGKKNEGIDCPAIVLVEEKAQEEQEVRRARFLVYSGKTPEGAHSNINFGSVSTVVDFLPQAPWLKALPSEALVALSALGKVTIEFAPEDELNAEAKARMTAVYKLMDQKKLAAPNPQLIPIPPGERFLLDPGMGAIKVNDLIFI